MWSRLCNKVIQRFLVPRVLDTQCGFKAFTAAAALNLFGSATIDGWAFDLEILALARRRGFEIEEVGVEWKDDERSHVNPFTDFWKVIREAVTIRRNLDRGVYGTTHMTSFATRYRFALGPSRYRPCLLSSTCSADRLLQLFDT